MKKPYKFKRIRNEMTASEFCALPLAERNRIYDEIDAMTPEEKDRHTWPLNREERAELRRWSKLKLNPGRPKLGKDGVGRVSVSIEKSLLKRAEKFAHDNGLGRSQMFARGLESLLEHGLRRAS